MNQSSHVQTINCPHCGKEIPLSDVLTKQIEDHIRVEYADAARTKDAEHHAALKSKDDELQRQLKLERAIVQEQAKKTASEDLALELKDLKEQVQEKTALLAQTKKRELDLAKKQRELEEKESMMDVEVKRQVDSERGKIVATTTQKNQLELTDLKTQLLEKNKKLEEAEKAELDLRKRQRALEEREKDQELEMQRKLDEQRKTISETARVQVEEEFRLKGREKDIIIDSMKKQIDDLKRKAEQGSMQIQGEAQEVELDDVLRTTFKYDDVERVGKGKEGADVLQSVRNGTGQPCGKILFESKRTKTWSSGWIDKAKEDQREAKADLVVIVSKVLPADVNHIGFKDGVWICSLQATIGLAIALREILTQVGHARAALAGKSEKMELIYKYLSGLEFKNRIESIVEAFSYMKEDLEAEKRSTYKRWAEREKQIDKVVSNASGLYGDLQGIIGGTLPEVKALELPAAAAPEETIDDLPF